MPPSESAGAARVPPPTPPPSTPPTVTGDAAGRWLPLALAGGLCLLTLAGFLPVLANGFVNFDDPQYVYANPRVLQGISAAGLRWALTAQIAGHWHPLAVASHMLDVQLYGLQPAGHHLTSLLLHLANVLLLFAVLRRMTGRPWRSAAVAALFAIHPTHVESVAWIAERKDVLCGLFWMLTLAAYLRYTRAPSAGRYLLVAAALAAALMAKTMAMTLPIALLLLDFWPLGRWPGRRQEAAGGAARRRSWPLLEKLPLLGMSAATGIVAVHTASAPITSGDTAPLALRLANALTSYPSYLGKTLDPRHLAAFYPFEAVPLGRAAAAAVLLAAITAAAVWAARRAPYLTVGWLWFLVTLVPVIGLLQVGWQAMADRYTYLPSIGLWIAGVWGIAELGGLAARRLSWAAMPRGRRRLLGLCGVAAAAALLVALTTMTRRQVRTWRDSSTLWNHALAVDESYLAHTNLAEDLRAHGDRAGALAHYQAALRLAPRSPDAHAALANALRSWGQPAAALQPLRAALAIDPRDERSRLLLAMSLDDLGRADLALAELRRVAADHPDSLDAQVGLAELLGRAGDLQGAAEHRRRAEVLAGRAGMAGPAGPAAPAAGRRQPAR